MSSTKKIIIVFSCILFVSLIGMGITLAVYFNTGNNVNEFGNIFGGGRFEVKESADFDLSGINAVEINCTSADVHIVESDKPGVRLEGVVVAPNPQREYLQVEKRDGTVYIKVDYKGSFLNIFTGFNLTVYMPSDNMLDLSVDCKSGDIDTAGMRFNNLTVSRTSGDVKIENCSAKMFDCGAASGNTIISACDFESSNIVSMSGDTRISGTTGSIRVRSTSGQINIEGAKGALDIGCTSGDISIAMADGEMHPVTAGLTSGNIRLYVPRTAAFNLEARTTSGNLTSDLDIAVSGKLSGSFIQKQLSGTVNGGGPAVTVTVTSGDISIIGK